MTDELPPLWALDKAAKAAGFSDWEHASAAAYPMLHRAIIAHARTIAQYEQPLVDEDEEALNRIFNAYSGTMWTAEKRKRLTGVFFPAALAQFKRELEGRK